MIPLVRAFSQADGGALQWQNCTATSGARLLFYATGKLATGSQVRARQSDQSGGTSLPDVMRALRNGWGYSPPWAAPNDSNAGRDGIPPNRQGDWITPAKLKTLLADHMVIVQGDYGRLPVQYREQADFVDDHAFTVDGARDSNAYVVDTIPRYGTGYDGRWIPWTALMSYAHGLAGTGRIYAAWGQPPPLPDTSTEDIVKVYSVPGQTSGAWPAGTAIHPGPTGPSSGATTVTRRFLLVGQDHPTAPTRYLVDGGGDAASSGMAWLPVAGMGGKRDETWEAGKAAAIAAARGATR